MNALEIKDLTKSYKNFQLGPVNLTLPCGCIMGLIGKNGAGKSTTIKLILDMIEKETGSITILGKNNQKELHITKEDIGVVLNEPGYPECIRTEQLGKIMKYTYKQWDDKVFLELVKKLKIPADTDFKDLSSGNKMKLGIAAAMSHHPKLLILDEATNGLDPIAREDVLDMLYEFTRDETHSILLSSHIVSDLEKLCDYITFIHNGKILLCEEKDRLLEQYGILRCGEEELKRLSKKAIKGKKSTPYGIEVVVDKDKLPMGMETGVISIEDLFIFMIKEEM